MDKSASLLVRQQVPEFVVNDSPRFIEFMKGYYEFLDSFNNPVDRLRNVDETTDELVQFLRHEFATRFPQAAVDDRKLIKIVRELYKVKGTVNAIDLLFRIFFSETVTVSEPGKQLLRPSDGRWEQFQSVTAISKFGSLPVDQSNLVLQFGDQESATNFIEASKIELAAANTYEIYFRYSNYTFEVDQEIDYYVGNSLVWKGRIVPSASQFEVVAGGNNWKVGQVIRFPGTVSDTILQVTHASTTGELQSVRPIEWGRFHSDNQTINVSPYPNKPTNATYDIQSNIVAYNAGTDTYIYNHVIEFNDYVDGLSEDMIGYSDTFTESSYVGADYVEQRYVGLLVIVKSSSEGSSSAPLQTNSSVTIEDWLASRATIACKFGPLTTYFGRYLTEDGQASNPSIRIQDSYFYQLFSYVIQSTRSIDEYSGILSVVHPAGYKYFNDLLRTDVVLANNFEVQRNITNDKLFLNDLIAIAESGALLDLIKAFGHSVTMTDASMALVTVKPIESSVTSTDSDTFAIGKLLATAQETSDVAVFSPTLFRAHTVTVSETDVIAFTKAANDETVPSDTLSSSINKNITAGTTSVDDNGSSNSQTRIEYTTEDFFGGDYVSDDITLQIG